MSIGVTVILDVPVRPCLMLRLVGLAVRPKSGLMTCTFRVIVFVIVPSVPLTVIV